MSSKTTFKRIALVAVAGLGLGVLSVAPSSAVQQMDSLTISSATAAQQTTETATATSAMRLNVVFVDICFLSIVDLRNFRRSAWN